MTTRSAWGPQWEPSDDEASDKHKTDTCGKSSFHFYLQVASVVQLSGSLSGEAEKGEKEENKSKINSK